MRLVVLLTLTAFLSGCVHLPPDMMLGETIELAETEPQEAVGFLLAALQRDDPTWYQPASYLLRHITQENQGFRAFASSHDRAQAVEAWLRWWEGARDGFKSRAPHVEGTTLIVDEMPGRLHGDDENPPGHLFVVDPDGAILFETWDLKMPYDAVRMEDGGYLINMIRARAVYRLAPDGKVISEIAVGGYPCALELLADGNVLVAGWDDDVPGFVREFDPDGALVWSLEGLRWPWKASRLANGNTLIADAGTNRVYEVTPDGNESWSVGGLGPDQPALFDALGPVWVQRLPDGNTLVSIRGQSRVVELDPAGSIVWEVGPEIVETQYSAVRLYNGNTLIADQGNFRVIEITVDKRIVWERRGIGYPAKAYRD